MTLPATTHVATEAGSGTPFPTQVIAGKEYPVGLNADQDGHIIGSLPAYGLVIPPVAVAANKIYFDLFNAQASTNLRLRKLFAIVATDVAVTGAVGVRLDAMRSTSVGTGGTAAVATGASKTAAAFWGFNPANPALPAGVTARAGPASGAADGAWLFPAYVFTEETNMSAHMPQFFNLLPELPTDQAIELPQNFGLKVVQGAVASVGNIGFFIVFTVEQ